MAPNSDGSRPKSSPDRQEGLSIEPEAGVTNIQELYANKSAYANKTVKVKGLVTKFNAGINGKRNWVHI
ncbi:MAG: hypothetical protein U5K79_14320 [Cyclobacteriaceae bacterium]|nr:hypothetical protein [Cyclobacteriaceae bacterium]